MMKKALVSLAFIACLPLMAAPKAKNKTEPKDKPAFEHVKRGDIVLYFGSPTGLFPETSPYSEPTLRVARHFFLVHPLQLRLDRPSNERALASDEDSIESWPVYELTRYSFLPEPKEPGLDVDTNTDGPY